jgi:hypothetical protein
VTVGCILCKKNVFIICCIVSFYHTVLGAGMDRGPTHTTVKQSQTHTEKRNTHTTTATKQSKHTITSLTVPLLFVVIYSNRIHKFLLLSYLLNAKKYELYQEILSSVLDAFMHHRNCYVIICLIFVVLYNKLTTSTCYKN